MKSLGNSPYEIKQMKLCFCDLQEKKDDFGFTRILEYMKWPLTIDEKQISFP